MVAIDDSDESRDAIEFARELLGDEHEAVVVNVATTDPPALAPLAMLTGRASSAGAPRATAGLAYPLLDPMTGVTVPTVATSDVADHAEAQARQTAERAADQLDADEAVVEFGDPAMRIVDVANEHHVDLIIVGTRDTGAVKRFFTGSVSRDVLENAPCSVLIVR